MTSVGELYEYHTKVRRAFLEALGRMPWSEVVKGRGASFESMRNIMLHMLSVEDHLINHFAVGDPAPWPPDEFDRCDSFEVLRKRCEEVEEKTAAFCSLLKEGDLSRRVGFRRGSGVVIEMTVEDILIQAFTEQLYHIGELIALMWQMDVRPPEMQWFVHMVQGGHQTWSDQPS